MPCVSYEATDILQVEDMEKLPAFLFPEEVARLLRVPLSTVESWRYRRTADGKRQGPRFIRVESRLRCRREDLLAYLAKCDRAADDRD